MGGDITLCHADEPPGMAVSGPGLLGTVYEGRMGVGAARSVCRGDLASCALCCPVLSGRSVGGTGCHTQDGIWSVSVLSPARCMSSPGSRFMDARASSVSFLSYIRERR